MQLCHHHDRRVAKNRKLGFRGHVRSTKFDVDWERRCFALVVSSFDKHSLLSLILWSLEIYAFPLCYTHLRGDNDFGSRVAGESCGRPWLARWVQSELGKSSSGSRGDATGITLPLSTPLDPKVHHADLAWRRKGFLGGRRMKIKLWRLHGIERTVHAPMLLFARQVIRCEVSAKVLLKATLISGSRLGCFTYGWLTLLEFMV